MRISKVEIVNFRNFRHIVVNTSQIMLLVGANDTGKSNFIYALRLVLDKRLSIADRKLKSDDFWHGIKPWGGEIIKISIEFTDYREDKNLRRILDSYTDGREGFAMLTFIYKPKETFSDEPNQAKERNYSPYLIGGGNSKAEWSVLNNLNISYIDALRNAEAELIARRQPLRSLLSLYDINANTLTGAESHMQGVNDVLAKVTQIGNLERDINDILSDVKEHIHELNPVLRLAANDAEAILKMLRILLQSDRLLSIDTTSLGLANLLYLALYLLDIEQREKIKAPIDGNEYEWIIPAIEEPEAHLHPHVQRLLFRKFTKRTNTSLILSTHSPHVSSVAPLNSIIMFRKAQSRQETIVSSTAGLKAELTPNEYDDIQRYLDVTRAELLFARAVIFVEGDAEEYMLPALAYMAGIDLDRYGITICNVRGTNFAPFVKLVSSKTSVRETRQGLGIPFAILTDGDKYVDLKRKAIHWAENQGGFNKQALSDLKKKLEIKSSVKLYSRIIKLGIPINYYAGLSRAMSLLDSFDVEDGLKNIILHSYDQQDWVTVIENLQRVGIFVNQWSFEPALIEANFSKDILESIIQCDVGPRILNSLQSDIHKGSISEERIEYWVNKIDEIGKGRIGQRLSANLMNKPPGAKPIPTYVQNAFDYLIGHLDTSTQSSVNEEGKSVGDEEE